MKEQKQILHNLEFWEQLVGRLHFLDIRILEYVYVQENGATYFTSVEKAMKKMNVRRTAIRNHTRRLEEFGLAVC